MQSPSYNCDQCSFFSKQKSKLIAHKVRTHSNLQQLKCDSSDYQAKTKDCLTAHKIKHLPEAIRKPRSCPQCPFKCRFNYELDRHLRCHSREKPFKCPLCPHRASLAGNLAMHIRTHTGEKQFNCSDCVYSCSAAGTLKIHVEKVHVNKGEQPFKCNFPGCGKNYTTRASVTHHIKRFHEKITKAQCPHCAKRFYSKSDCDVHILRCITNEKPFKCGQCDYTAATALEARRHENTKHTDYLNVECPICQKTYKNKQSLAAHKYREHRDKPCEKPRKLFKCQEQSCTKEFQTASGLKRHKNSFHLNLRPFKCPFCEHSSSTSDRLNSHVKTHTGERPHKCKECKSSFLTRVCLRIHERTRHSDLRPFECPDCEYKAKTKAILKGHRRNHDPTFNYECTICKDSQGASRSQRGEKTVRVIRFFKQRTAFMEHLRKHSDEIPFKCQHCHYSTKVPSYFRKHLLRMHASSASKAVDAARAGGAQQLYLKRQDGSKASSNRNYHSPNAPSAPDAQAATASETSCKPCYVRLVRL